MDEGVHLHGEGVMRVCIAALGQAEVTLIVHHTRAAHGSTSRVRTHTRGVPTPSCPLFPVFC